MGVEAGAAKDLNEESLERFIESLDLPYAWKEKPVYLMGYSPYSCHLRMLAIKEQMWIVKTKNGRHPWKVRRK